MTAKESTDIAIVGGGPAGSACALALRNSGLQVTLIDKEEFPRDKVCGDAIANSVPDLLGSILPDFRQRVLEFGLKNSWTRMRIYSPSGNLAEFEFSKPGFISKRIDFDNLLHGLVDEFSETKIVTGQKVMETRELEGGVEICLEGGRIISTKLLIGADGSNSVAGRAIAGDGLDHDHHCAAVRGYYRGISCSDNGNIEIWFLEGYLPGYFWIFPLGDGQANVGFGMLSSECRKRKINLREVLLSIPDAFPEIGKRFVNSELIGSIAGFGLPLGSKKRRISAKGILLTGDAAGLINPFTGEGISNAIASGIVAAKYARIALKANDFSADLLRKYDEEIYAGMWKVFRSSYLMRRLLSDRTWMINFFVHAANRSRWLKKIMKDSF